MAWRGSGRPIRRRHRRRAMVIRFVCRYLIIVFTFIIHNAFDQFSVKYALIRIV